MAIICDGCNVRPHFEHRCHGSLAKVGGEWAGATCECPGCPKPCVGGCGREGIPDQYGKFICTTCEMHDYNTRRDF